MKLKNIYLDYSDFHRALITILPCILSIIIAQFANFSDLFTWMFVLSATLIGLGNSGQDKKQQTFVLLGLAMLAVCGVGLTTWLHGIRIFPLFYFLFFILLFFILSLSYWVSSLHIGLIIVGIMMISSMTFPLNVVLSVTQVAVIFMEATLLGSLLCILMNLILPTNFIPLISFDRTAYFFKRIFRISICVVFALFVAHVFFLKHSAWITVTVLIVSQANLGASVKRAGQRFLGTFFGIILAIPVAIFIYLPYPNSRWLAIVTLFFAFLLSKRYYLSIFFGVFTLAAIYFIFSTTRNGVIFFILDRLLETIFGIIIAILGELFIFPRTLVNYVRTYLKQYWVQVVQVLSEINNQKHDKEINSFSTLDHTFKIVETNINDFKYEPLIFLSKRFQLMKKFLKILEKFNNDLHVFQKQSIKPEHHVWINELIHSAQHVVKLYEIDQKSREAHIAKIINYYNEKLSSVLFKRQNAEDENFRQLYRDMLKIFIQYKRILQTPKWEFSLTTK